jgi:hypothetical protein
LAVGNFLNGSGNKGDSYGMKLADLEKFSLIKSGDGKQSLLMFVIIQAVNNEGKDVVNVNEKIEDYQVLQRI